MGIERVTGTVGGREGTFLLQDAGTVSGNVVSGDWFVVPGSGTRGLARLRGEGGRQIRHHLAGNICRCTGYGNIVTAVQRAARTLSGQ